MADRQPDVGQKPPGWYPDQRRAATLRYWDGSGWTHRRRPWPGSTEDDSDAPDVRPGRSMDSRRRWLLIAGVAVLAAAGLIVAGEALRPRSAGPRVLSDTRFVALANQECTRTLPGLRPPEQGPFGQSVTPAQAADGIDRAADGLDGLAGRLAALPAAEADRQAIDTWLAGWRRYTGLGRQYATFLRQHGSARPPGGLQRGANTEARLEEQFAAANGLKRCTFSFTPRADPQGGF